MNKKTVYITTPIYYVNAEPHIGHTYTTIIADALKRFHRLTGKDAYLLTGTDEHGEKIQQKAVENSMTPQAFSDMISAKFKETWDAIGIEYDDFIRTTEEKHIEVVKQILQKVYDKGDIYFSEYEGDYCVGCERFLRASELVNGECPDHDKAPQKVKESNYFFKMGKYQQAVIDHISQHEDFILLVQYKKEILSFLQDPLEDLCISRPKTRLEWGIELPFDSKYVTYVWFDALLNYVSALGWPNDEKYAKYWPTATHCIGKDILKTHAIYWPTMLLSAEIPLFQHLYVNGYWMRGETKMSKTLGNVVSPLEFKEKFGIESLRYFYFREMSFGADANFTYELFIEKYNSDLANGLGNLFNRTCSMVNKYFDGIIPNLGTLDAHGKKMQEEINHVVTQYQKNWDDLKFHLTLQDQWNILKLADQYIEETKPWALAKSPETQDTLKTVLSTILEMLRIQAVLLYPIIPETSQKMLTTLQSEIKFDGNENFEEITTWGNLATEKKLGELSPLFPRIETT